MDGITFAETWLAWYNDDAFWAMPRRIAPDGGYYTLADFINWYGFEVGGQMWPRAPVHRAAEERRIAE